MEETIVDVKKETKSKSDEVVNITKRRDDEIIDLKTRLVNKTLETNEVTLKVASLENVVTNLKSKVDILGAEKEE
eukprot:CAMPEP_0197253916 /NCGR_PEP_ID=MMETSP1429-20130617/66717_1 /TAXON_ID=49237 /ORGANISM="Chaetoceros  sp., Strain UNC1202" /LENGTH=74 /DNA_ID=CAMNT_0042716739 /DNA_START=96 /DNA_END=317 /DNA_ORIENTATION=-